MSTKNKLFLVCPDCYLEHSISLYYPGNAYFLTSLGAVFDFSDPAYAKTVRDFMQEEEIEQLYFVNACSCRFIQTALSQKKGYNTLAEAELTDPVEARTKLRAAQALLRGVRQGPERAANLSLWLHALIWCWYLDTHPTGGTWITWWLSSPEAVDDAHTLALRENITVTVAPMDMPWGVRECHLRHPDGHTFRVSAGIEAA